MILLDVVVIIVVVARAKGDESSPNEKTERAIAGASRE
jgi:hypothetical protein